MNPRDPIFHWMVSESDFWAWAPIVEEEHGQPLLFDVEELETLSDTDPSREVRRLRGRVQNPYD